MAGQQEVQAPGGTPKTAVENPCMGLFLDRPAHTMDPKALQACNNVRIELGRVRSDLIGWAACTIVGGNVSSLGPVIWIDSIALAGAATPLIVTNTDIFQMQPQTATTYEPIYRTPTYSPGSAQATNGSATVSGTAGTHWAGDITGGSQTCNTTTTISAGSTSLTINVSSSNQYLLNVLPGMPITDTTQGGAIPNGTYITTVTQTSGPTLSLGISQSTTLSIPSTDTIFLGSGQTLRANVRAGDYIGFGQTDPSLITTWYEIKSVSADGTGASAGTSTLTLNSAYTGTNYGPGIYCIRQCLTSTTGGATPYIPSCSSDNIQFPAGFNGVGTGASCPVQWFFTNGIDPVVVFFDNAVTPNCQYARSLPFTCASLKQFKGLMTYGGLSYNNAGSITNFGTSIANSDDNLPLQLNSGIAFQGIATSGPFTITRIGILGSTLMLYGSGLYSGGSVANDDMGGVVTSASLVGFPTTWAFSDVIQTRGPVSGGMVAIFPDRHEFLSIDGEYRYNGLFVQIMNDHIWREVLKQFDLNRPGSAFAAIIPTFGDVIWVTPQTTDPNGQLYASSAYVEHYMEQANSYLFKPYTMRDFPFTAMTSLQRSYSSFAASQPIYYAGDFNGNIWQLYVQVNQNTNPPLCTATWASRILGSGRTRDLVRRVYPFLEYQASPAGTVNVTLTLQDRPAGPTTITDTQTFNLTYGETATDNEGFTSHFRRGRVASVTLSDSAGVGWVADGYDWDTSSGGWR